MEGGVEVVISMLRIFGFFTLILSGVVMAKDVSELAYKVGQFSLFWSGDQQYGSREISFDGLSKYRFAIGDTVNYESRKGVGVFELDLRSSDLENVRQASKALCERDIQSGGAETTDPSAIFNVTCLAGC